jgi:hypothetical protein
MPKAKQDENDDDAKRERSEEGSADDEDTNSDSAELTPVRPKIGESKDNLRQRSDHFQKRRS